jgi:hypothetical protein
MVNHYPVTNSKLEFSVGRKLFSQVVILLLISFTAFAQTPSVLYTSLTSTTPAPSNSRYNLTTMSGVFKQVRFQANQTVASGGSTWAFHQGSTGSPDYSNNWRPYTSNNVLSSNTYIPVTFDNGAKYNSGGGGSDGQLPAITSGNYYTFNVTNNATANNIMQLLETTYNPVTITNVSQASGTFGSRLVTITTSGTPNAAENIYVRYSTNSYASSTLVQATGSGTTWTATIPWQSGAVSFYVYTSNKTLTQINNDVTTYGQTTHDMSTLNLNNNGGTNYSWTPATGAYIVTSTGGTSANTAVGYATLTTATTGLFAVLNGGTVHTGTVTVLVTADVTTEPGTTGLNNSAAWTALTINPNGARTISGTVGAALISLSGADNVTINGLNANGNTLTISNLSAAATSGTSTISFTSDATSNTITNCTVLGSSSMAVGTNGGTIFFSTGTTTGNDNNTISNCNIGPAGTNLPTKAISGNGSTTSTAIGNSGINITNNNIYDYFGAAVASAGIYVNGGCNTWSITNNKFYQTATRTWTTGAVHNAINIQNTSASSGAQGFTITGNIIGYSNSSSTGTYALTGSTGSFRGIQFNGITGGTNSDISSNTISNISLTGVSSSGTGTSSPFMCIFINNGVATTNSNLFGSQSATGSLTFNSTSTTATDVYGIYNFSSDNWTSNLNQIGGITATFSGTTTSLVVYGLRANTGSTLTWTCNNNTIGGTVSNSIQNSSTSTGAQNIGIYNSNAIGTFTSNIIRNLTSAGGTGSGVSSSVIGISLDATSTNQNVSQNQIFNLSNSNTGATAVTVTGIRNGSTGVNTLVKNFVYNFSVATSVSSNVNGIAMAATTGTNTIQNNLIRLGYDSAGATITGGHAFNGFNSVGGTNNYYFNSVYVGGTNVTGAGTTSCFVSTGSTTHVIDVRNNIFFNARSNGTGTGKHYAINFSTAPTSRTTNYNDYFVNGTGGFVGFLTSDRATLAAWQTATAQDVNSQNGDPQFIAATATTPDLHIHATNPTPIEGSGIVVASVTDDYDGQTRSGLTPTDMGADAGNFVSTIIACATPTAQPTALTFSSVTTTTLSGSFTAASPAPTGYLVIRSTSATLSGNPVDGTSYSAGNALGGGTVVIPSGTTFTDTGLTAGTTYYYFVLSFNSGSCSGGPKYFTTSPLTNSQATVCSTATGLAAATITSGGATLSWTGTGNYIVEYGAAGFTPGTGATAGVGGTIASSTASTSYVLSGLTSNTIFDVYVRQVCPSGGLYSANSTKVTFTTLQIPATLPYTQNFASANDFSFVNGAVTNKWVYGTAAGNPANALYISNDSGVTNAYTVTAATSTVHTYRDIAIPTGTTLTTLTFDWKANGETSWDYLRVWLVPITFTPTAGTQITAGSGRIQVGGNLNLVSTWQTYSNTTLDLSSFANTTMRLVFEWTNDASTGTQTPAAIDNISLSVPTCAIPTMNATTNISSTTATINWTAPTSAPSNGYNYEIRTSGAAGSGATGLTTSGSVGAGIVTANVTGLTAATTYSIYVQSNCGGSDTSIWTVASTFTTACEVPNNPTMSAFTAVTATTITVNYAAATPVPTAYVVFRSTSAVPPTPVNGTSYSTATNYTFGGNTYRCLVNGTALNFADTGLTSNTTYYYYVYSRNSTNSCFGAPWYSTGTTASQTTCPAAPTTFVNSNITANGATISWTASSGGTSATIYYILEVTTDSGYTTPILGSPFSVGTPVTYVLSGLLPSTTYYYRVKANNGSCDSTYLTGSFTTACSSLNVPYTQNFDGVTQPSLPACMAAVDSNADTIVWKTCNSTSLGNGTAVTPNSGTNQVGIAYNGSLAMNDWLMLPGINMTGGTSYRLSFYARGYTGLSEIFEVKYGTSATAAAMTNTIVGSTTITGGTAYALYSYDFTPTSTGVYYIGIHGISAANQWYLFVDDIKVDLSPSPITITPSPSATICNGDSTTLTASSTAGYTYSWSPSSGLSSTTGATVSANPTTTTTYTVTGTAGSMVNTQTITVTVNPAPAAIALNVTSANVCASDVTTLTATSQTPATFTIGTAATSSVAANTPYRQAVGVNNQSRVQYLVTKAELNAAGLTTASNITSLAFTVTTVGTGAMSSYSISMAHTNLSAFSGTTYQSSGFSTVYSGTNITPTAGVNTYTFSTPFAWDGNSNIIINVCHQGAGGTASVVSVSSPTSVSTMSGSGASQCTINTGGATNANRPMMILGGFTPLPITWNPTTGLYTDAAATINYTGSASNTVYAKPTVNTTYTATATLGSCTKTATSSITLKPDTVITTQPQSQTVCQGGAVSFTVAASNSPSGYLYQWKKNGSTITGETNATYTISNVALADAATYTVEVLGECGGVLTSNGAVLTVNPSLPASVSIAASSTSICPGDSIAFTATPTNGGALPTYQWKVNGLDVIGETNTTFTTSSLSNGDVVSLVMTSNASPCLTSSPATSNTLTITVNPILTASVAIATTSTTVCSGSAVTFTATPTNGGTAPTYQWKVNGIDVSGETAATFTTSTLVDADVVTVVMNSNASPCLTGSPATSNSLTITVNPALTASVSIAASASTLCSGTSVTFTATPTNGGTTPSYQWKVNGNNVGTDSPIYTTTALNHNDVVTVELTSNASPCLTGSPATSNAITVTVNALSSATITSSNGPTLCSGSDVTYIVSGTTNAILYYNLNGGGTQFTILTGGSATITVSGATATQTLNLVSVDNGVCPVTLSETATVIIESTTWDGSTWSNGIPNSSKAAIIAGNMTITSNIEACSLTVNNNAVVTVTSGYNVTLQNAITVAAGSTFTVNSNANLIQVNPAAVNSGNIIVKRISNPLIRLDYILWGSPVAGQSLFNFSSLTSVNPTIRFYTYNSATNSYNSVADYATHTMNVGKGYLIRLPFNHPTAPAIWTGTFTGVPNNGTITQTLANNGAGFRYNAVSNPYPSTLNMAQFYADNVNAIEPTLYYWRKTNSTSNPSYCSYNLFTDTYTDNGQPFTENPNGAIQVGQGFFVEAKNASTSVVFNNGQRFANNANQMFRSSTPSTQTIEKHRIWLNLTGAAGEFSQAMVGYFTGGTLGADATDAKFFNDGTAVLNSKINGVEYIMNGRPVPFDSSDIVPMNFKVTTAGSYTIAIDHKDGLFADTTQDIYLKDNETATYHNLNNGPYTFTAQAGSFENRFELVYQNALSTIDQTLDASDFAVVKSNGKVAVKANTTIQTVTIYDIHGRLITQVTNVNAQEVTLPVQVADQVLLVQVTSTEKKTGVKKAL